MYLDTETRSPVPIQHGTDRYMSQAECLILTWAREGAAQLWQPARGEPMPADLADGFADPNELVICHNLPFDRAVLARCLGIKLPIERHRCTLAQAQSHGYPGSLETLGKVLELPEDQRKMGEGHRLIQRFCVPHDDAGNFYDWNTHPEDWELFSRYALQDTETLRLIHQRLPKVNYQGENLEAWWINELINERGFGFDQELAHAARKLLDSQKARHERDMIDRTDNAVQAATQREKLKRYLASKGLHLPNMRASTISEWLEHDDLSPEIRYLLEARLEASKSSGAKYLRGLQMVGEGSRIRYALRFSGAGRTGRFSGRGFQPHNMMRPVTYVTLPDGTRSKKPVKADTILNLVVPGIKTGKVLDNEIVYGGPNEACANALRCAIVAAPGNELVVADWSNIESRVLAWIADETWKLEAYRAVDRGEGADLYKLLYSKFFNTHLDDVDDQMRQSGKVVELACLAPETEVLTDRGYVAIVEVLPTDKVWDGREWVSHEGLVERGVRPVVDVDGIRVTPDHLIATPEMWRPASELASNSDSHFPALATGSANLPVLESPRHKAAVPDSTCDVRVATSLTWTPEVSAEGSQPAATSAPNAKPPTLVSANDTRNTPDSYQTQSTDADCSIDWQPLFGVANLPRIGAIQTTEAAASEFTPRGERIRAPSSSMSKPSPGGTTRASNSIAKTSMGITSQGTSDSSPNSKTLATSDPSEPCKQESPSLRPVYDLANAGLRNRFTVRTDNGHMVVHNCGFGGGVGAFVTMAAVYEMDLDAMAPTVLATATEAQLKKAHRAWKRAFLEGEDYDLHPRTYKACDILKQAYRASNAEINKLRHAVNDATLGAIREPGRVYDVAKCRIWATPSFLIIQLPSGRRLLYAKPQLEQDTHIDPETGEITHRDYITYLTARGKGWIRERAWSGLFIENIVQAVANDVLRAAMRATHRDAGSVPAIRNYLEMVEGAETALSLHVHDEIALDVPAGSYPLKRLIELITTKLVAANAWMRGLPLAATGWVGSTYHKG